MASNQLFIEISDYDIKLLEAKKSKNKLIVSKVKKESTLSLTEEEKSNVLRKLLGHKKRSKLDCNILVSTSNILTKTVEVPKLKKKEVRSLLENNLPQYFAVEGEDYLSSYKILKEFQKEVDEKQKDFFQLLLIAYPKDMFQSIMELCQSANLNPTSFDVYPNVIFDTFSKYNEPISIVDVQEDGANCIILNDRELFLYALFNPN